MPAIAINNIIGNPFIELQSVDSTNNYAMALVKNNMATHGTTVFAREQTGGKGRRGKAWQSSPGKNIILSVILDTSWLQLSFQFHLSIMVAVALHDFFNKYATEFTAVKWPNDIYWCDRKAAGILIENIVRATAWQWSVAGIGVNINQTKFDSSLSNPVSLKQITGKHFDVAALAKELCSHLDKRYTQLKERGINELLSFYNKNLYKKGDVVRLRKGNVVFDAIIKEVNDCGQLITKGSTENIFNLEEIEWMIQ